MTIETINGVTILTPQKDYRLTNGVMIYEPNQPVFLAVSDSADNWNEISEIVLPVWNVKENHFILNPNGSNISVSSTYDQINKGEILEVVYDTNNYCGGTLIKDIDFICKSCRITYKSDVNVRIHLQYNDKAYNNYVILGITDDYKTINVDIDEKINVNHFEFYVSTENGDRAKGTLYIKDISLIN